MAPKYFDTLGIPLLAGRDFTFNDAGRSRVAIISESMARHYFPGRNPIGMHINIDRSASTGGWYGDDQPYEVVGVVGDAKYIDLREAPPRTMYFNMFQEQRIFHQFALRTSVDPASVANSARRIAREILKSSPVMRVTTLSEQVDAAIVPERLIATLSGFFSALGVALSGIGLYGLLAYTVARRTNEIGVRMALGATARDVSRLVLGDSLAMVCGGLLAGAVLMLWTRPFAVRLVQDLKPASTVPLASACVVILEVAQLASYIPVRRAARIDPMNALRTD